MNVQFYTLRWRGVESGPYPFPVLERMLEESQICLWHEVLQNDQWITLEELLMTLAPTPQLAAAKTQAQQPKTVPQTAVPVGPSPRAKLPRLHNGNGPGGV